MSGKFTNVFQHAECTYNQNLVMINDGFNPRKRTTNRGFHFKIIK